MGRAGRPAIQERTRIAVPVGAKARHLQGAAIVTVAGHRPADDADPHQLATADGANRKLVTNHGRVMPMQRGNKGVSLGQRDGHGRQMRTRQRATPAH